LSTTEEKKSLKGEESLSRYSGAVCRICRREGMKIYLKGDRCYTDKCGIERRAYPPGQHRVTRRKHSDFSLQLREKQKVRSMYGLHEKQFSVFFERAEKMKGATGSNFLSLLERRLDNVVYRLGLSGSRAEARQQVKHGFYNVDGKKVSIPSFIVKKGHVITLRKKAERVNQALEESAKRERPGWLDINSESMEGVIKELPVREDITLPIEEKLIVEYYSR
jgi:small subunit ribosomal protein S4